MKNNAIRLWLVVFLLIIGALIFHIDKPLCLNLLYVIQSFNGISAILLLSIIYIISNLLILPLGLPISLLAGMLWGTIGGGVLVNILATLVAAISFYLGRWFGLDWLTRVLKKHAFLNNINNTINQYDWQFIMLVRINPIVPFGLSNYLFGVVPGLSFRHYIIATALANLIPTFIFASIGSILKTFSLTNNNIQHFIFQIGITLLLVSALFILKVMIPIRSKRGSEIT